MSNINDINFKGTGNDIDDAEGHVLRAGKLDDGAGDDAEGHGRRFPESPDSAPDDVEGHATRGKGIDDGSDDDAEGHVAKSGRSATTGTAPGKPRIKP